MSFFRRNPLRRQQEQSSSFKPTSNEVGGADKVEPRLADTSRTSADNEGRRSPRKQKEQPSSFKQAASEAGIPREVERRVGETLRAFANVEGRKSPRKQKEKLLSSEPAENEADIAHEGQHVGEPYADNDNQRQPRKQKEQTLSAKLVANEAGIPREVERRVGETPRAFADDESRKSPRKQKEKPSSSKPTENEADIVYEGEHVGEPPQAFTDDDNQRQPRKQKEQTLSAKLVANEAGIPHGGEPGLGDSSRSFADNDRQGHPRKLRDQLSFPKPMDSEAGTPGEVEPFAGNDKRGLESRLEGTDHRPQMDTKRRLSAMEDAPDSEEVRGVAAHRDKPPRSPVQRSPSSPGSNQVACQQSTSIREDDPHVPISLSISEREPRPSDAAKTSAANPDVALAAQIAELKKRYEVLSKNYESVQDELQAKNRDLEEKDSWIMALTSDVSTLQQTCDEQSTELASVRNKWESCQSQLDNVQRFISTADALADHDIIQKLQELNEEMHKMSTTMADYVAESFMRTSLRARRKRDCTHPWQDSLATIDDVMVSHLTTMVDDDVALFLEIAFHAYLSHFLCRIVSSWTTDQSLDDLIEGTYQVLRNAETQAISGRWRSLTRTYILQAPASNSQILVGHVMAGLSDIIATAGLTSRRDVDAVSKLSSEFGEETSFIVSRAETFGRLISGMISGDFETFAVPPGEVFDRESMVDINEGKVSVRRTRAAQPQTVLCAFRMGLRKRKGGKVMTLIKAQVVLKSFMEQ